MAIIKRPFKVKQTDGTWNIHHFETGEDMLVDIAQTIGTTGYRKFPGGLILQRLTATITPNTGYARIVYPIAFTRDDLRPLAVATQRYESEGSVGLNINFTTQANQTQIIIYAREPDNSIPNRYAHADVFVLGY